MNIVEKEQPVVAANIFDIEQFTATLVIHDNIFDHHKQQTSSLRLQFTAMKIELKKTTTTTLLTAA